MSDIYMYLGVSGFLFSLPGTLELFTLTLWSLFKSRKKEFLNHDPLKIVVIIPAHNEKIHIRRVVRSVLNCDFGNHEVSITVIADNCTDDTANISHLEGANVLERNDLQNRGKGQALNFAFQILLNGDYDVFVIVDADSVVENNFILKFASCFQKGADAAQCRYLVENPTASEGTRLMNLALMAMHVIRPKGRNRLNLSCGIFGNGFALSRKTIEEVPYLANSITEDLEYHIDLLKADKKVEFIDETTVRADFPESIKEMSSQRERWEGGRLRLVREKTLYLIIRILKGDLHMTETLLDLLTLPMSFHVMLILLTLLIPYSVTQIYGVVAIAIVGIHVLSAIWMAGTKQNLLALFTIPFYIIWKVFRIRGILNRSGKGAGWVRTPRGNEKT